MKHNYKLFFLNTFLISFSFSLCFSTETPVHIDSTGITEERISQALRNGTKLTFGRPAPETIKNFIAGSKSFFNASSSTTKDLLDQIAEQDVEHNKLSAFTEKKLEALQKKLDEEKENMQSSLEELKKELSAETSELRTYTEKEIASLNEKGKQFVSSTQVAVNKLSEELGGVGEELDELQDVDQKQYQLILEMALENQDIGTICKLIEFGVTVTPKQLDKHAILHVAAFNGDLENVTKLLAYGANINAQDKSGGTPYYYAVQMGRDDVIDRLLEEDDLDVAIAENKGWTPLHIAAANNRLDDVKYLVEDAEVDVDVQTKQQETPLYIAAGRGNCEMVTALLTLGAKPNIETCHKETPLHYAAQEGHLKIVDELLQAGAKPAVKNNDGETPLYLAIKNNHIQTTVKISQALPYSIAKFPASIEGIFEREANIKGDEVLREEVLCAIRNEKIKNISHYQNSDETINLLGFSSKDTYKAYLKNIHTTSEEIEALSLEQKIHINELIALTLNPNWFKDIVSQKEALYTAVEIGNIIALKIIVQLNPKIVYEVLDYIGTPLHAACRYKYCNETQFQMIEFLVESGADVEALHGGDERPLDTLREFNPENKKAKRYLTSAYRKKEEIDLMREEMQAMKESHEALLQTVVNHLNTEDTLQKSMDIRLRRVERQKLDRSLKDELEEIDLEKETEEEEEEASQQGCGFRDRSPRGLLSVFRR